MKRFIKRFMKRRTKLTVSQRGSIVSVIALVLMLSSTNWALAGGKDDPVLGKLMIDQLEVRDANKNNPVVLAVQGWLGQDLQKIWFKADVERVDGQTEESALAVLYSRAISPFWDAQVGVKQDFQPTPSRAWAVIGLQGLAPYFFDIDTALLIGESGRTALQLDAEYELLFTQRLILTPEVEVNVYGQNDAELGIGSGLSDIEVGLRLRYEIRREFAPYIGVSWNQSTGNTASFARSAEKETDELQWVVGVRAWL